MFLVKKKYPCIDVQIKYLSTEPIKPIKWKGKKHLSLCFINPFN